MMAFNYGSAALPVREDLKESYREFWNTLAQAGTWWEQGSQHQEVMCDDL